MASEFTVPILAGMNDAAAAMGYGSFINWCVAKGFGRPNAAGGVDFFKSALTASQPAFPYKALYLAFAADLQVKQGPVPPALITWLQQNGFANLFTSTSEPTKVDVVASDPKQSQPDPRQQPSRVDNSGPPRKVPMQDQPQTGGLPTGVKIAIGVGVFGLIAVASNPKLRQKLSGGRL